MTQLPKLPTQLTVKNLQCSSPSPISTHNLPIRSQGHSILSLTCLIFLIFKNVALFVMCIFSLKQQSCSCIYLGSVEHEKVGFQGCWEDFLFFSLALKTVEGSYSLAHRRFARMLTKALEKPTSVLVSGKQGQEKKRTSDHWPTGKYYIFSPP